MKGPVLFFSVEVNFQDSRWGKCGWITFQGNNFSVLGFLVFYLFISLLFDWLLLFLFACFEAGLTI